LEPDICDFADFDNRARESMRLPTTLAKVSRRKIAESYTYIGVEEVVVPSSG
jgi:hypothetical protein